MQRRDVGARRESNESPKGFGTVEFCAAFQASFRVLWLIAVGTVREASHADDVIQDAAVVALGKLNEFQPGTNFTAWMGKVVRYVGLNHVRRERKHRATTVDLSTTDGERTLSGRSYEMKELAPESALFDQRVQRALDDVGDVARTCLLLRTVEGMTYDSISRLLDIPEGTAMSHVHRTRQLLRGRLAEFWAEGSASREGRS